LKNLVVIENLNIAYITLSKEELERYHYKKGDTEGFVNYGLSLKGIKLAAILIENPWEGHIRISLRSKGSFPVNELAKSYFSGGGHINAAGGRSDLTLEATIEKLLSAVTHYKSKLI
ncbi:MAG: DHHA1 domain-containing protein, partial [Bacteroidota bacterium]